MQKKYIRSFAVIFLPIFFTIFVAGKYLYPSYSKEKKLPNTFYRISKSDMHSTLTVSGVLKAKKYKKIFPPTSRARVLTYIIEEGSKAKKGEILAKFDKEWLLEQIQSLKKEILEANRKLCKSQTLLEILKIKSKSRINGAKIDWRIASLEKSKYQKATIPFETKKKKIDLEIAKLNLKRNRRKFEHLPYLLKHGFITESRVKEEKIKLRKKEIEMGAAKDKLEMFQKYTKAIELFKKNSELARTRKQLQTIKKKISSEEKKYKAQILRHKAKIGSLQKRLDRFKEDLKKTVIKAPFDCLIVYGDPKHKWMKRYVKVGTRLWSGLVIFTLPDLSKMKIEMKIKESYLHYLKVGMPVCVNVEGANLKKLKGKIDKISEVADKEDWLSDPLDKNFKVEVCLESSLSTLLPGMSAKVKINIVNFANITKIPSHAVYKEGKNYFVYLAKNSKEKMSLEKKFIKIGKRGIQFTEVKNLKNRDYVFLGTPYLIHNSAPKKQKKRKQKFKHD